MEAHHAINDSMVKSTISVAIINSELFVYQGVMGLHGIQKQVNTVK